jgi:hypothetical protein
MPITFLEAKARVSPDKPVVPGSKEHRDIIELMRQSGRVFAEDNVPPAPPPPPQTLRDIRPFRERDPLPPRPIGTSKKDWLNIDVNKKAYDEHLKKNAVGPTPETAPRHLEWKGKTPPAFRSGMSKREWITQLK